MVPQLGKHLVVHHEQSDHQEIRPVNRDMLILARESSGLTQSELARRLKITQATISRYEAGRGDIPHEHLFAIAKELERPIEFFYWSERQYGASCAFYRKRQSIQKKEIRAVTARVNILRMQAMRLLEESEIEPTYSFHRFDVRKVGGPEEVARRVRQMWQMPPGPVDNVVDSIESAGGIIYRMSFGNSKIDGVSQWPMHDNGTPPVFFISDQMPGDRSRFNLAHELGHAVMHHHLPTDDPEDEANRFAAEFLMPEHDIRDELRDLNLPRAAALKEFWKVSMQSLIYRARKLEMIGQNRYEYLFKQMTILGYRRTEPIVIEPEEPRLIKDLLDMYRSSTQKRSAEISESLGMLNDEFVSRYLPTAHSLRLIRD